MKKSQEKALYSIPGWEEFVSKCKIEFLPFEDAREFARNLKLNGKVDWDKWKESDDRPYDVPKSPADVYRDCGWISWGDFLGTGNIAPQNRKFRSFEDAMKFVRNLKFKRGSRDWQKWCKSGKKPDDIPSSPYNVYKDCGWVSWSHFLGNKLFLTFEEAREFACNLKLNGEADWRKWKQSSNRPDNIPSTPSAIYKDSGWIGWGDFLGTGNVFKKDFRSFEDARNFVRNLNLNEQRDWQKWSKSNNRPDDIPSDPPRAYKDSGWIGWGDWLGTGNISNHNREYRSFEKARSFARNLKLDGARSWNEWRKRGERPDDIPTNPARTYKNSGWISWGDFLGTGNVRGHVG